MAAGDKPPKVMAAKVTLGRKDARVVLDIDRAGTVIVTAAGVLPSTEVPPDVRRAIMEWLGSEP